MKNIQIHLTVSNDTFPAIKSLPEIKITQKNAYPNTIRSTEL